MSRTDTDTGPPLHHTTFLVPGIHCASCTNFIDDLLFRLRPQPAAVESSIITHRVTVAHHAALRAETIAQTLGEAGYEVDSIIAASYAGQEPTSPASLADGHDDDNPLASLGQALERWNASKHVAEQEAARRRHVEHCEQCRADAQEMQKDPLPLDDLQPPPSRHPASEKTTVTPSIIVESLPPGSPISRASLSIGGMTCSSCVGNITSVLEQKPWVRSVNVNLLTSSATVDFEGAHDAQELAAAVEDVGYEATLLQVDKLERPSTSSTSSDADFWKASYSIDGMTCSSCVGNITNALEKLAFVKTVDVNLITNSAIVVFDGKARVDSISGSIEDVGYGAKLIDVVRLSDAKSRETRRTASVRVDGMYCEHCPARVTKALDIPGRRISIEQVPTTKVPIVSFSYTPDAPDFTIRNVLGAIRQADPAFTPAIHHPPSIAERAKRMHTRVRQRILYRVLLSVTAAIPTFVIGIVYMSLIPDSSPGRQYLMQKLRGVTRAEWALFITATPVYFFAADLFHRRTIKELHALWRKGSSVPMLRRFYRFGSMDMLLSMGTTIAYVSSIANLIITSTVTTATASTSANSTYFDSVVLLTMFLLIGRLIEAYSKAKTGEVVMMLGKLRPKEALLVLPSQDPQTGDRTESVHADLIDTGDRVRVVQGGSSPWDGIMLEGEGVFDESSLTGESKPVKKTTGDQIFAGTVNNGGPIMIRTTGASGSSMLDQIIKVVEEGQARRAPIERIADVLTGYFVPVVTLIAILTWLIWLSLGLSGALPAEYLDSGAGGWPFWSLQFAIAVFVIACPCGIGLAAPTALMVGGGLAAKYGILAKGGGEAFQEASRIDVMVFDKTGTLTEGSQPKITDHQILSNRGAGWGEKALLDVLAGVEEQSSHPLGRALVEFCEPRNGTAFHITRAEEIAGKGMVASFTLDTSSQSIELLVGNEALMADYHIVFDTAASYIINTWKEEAKSVILVAARTLPLEVDSAWIPFGIFAASDPLRPEASSVVAALGREGVEIWMISGDNQTTAHAVGAMVGIPPERIIGGVLPSEKADEIKYLQQSQARPRRRQQWWSPRSGAKRAIVAMTGDGVNDSPALAVADVGIAIGSGSDVAISAAGFVLVNSDLRTLLTLITLSRAVLRRVKFNFAWALVYNLAALPIAAGVLYPVKSGGGQHVRLDPVWASLAMALSSISVICSSLLLRSRVPFVGFTNRVGR